MTTCACTHLTNFGSGFIVLPNTIDFSYVFAHTGFLENLAIYLTMIITLAVYIFMLIWARMKDKKDLQRLGVTPLPDNNPSDKYLYEILIQTGNQSEAPTDSKVSFILNGELDATDIRTFGDSKYLLRRAFRKNALDNFVMAVPRPLGNLNYLRIWHDNGGRGSEASWFLDYVVFRDLQTGQRYTFIAHKWFAVEKSDGVIDRLLPVAGKEQMTQFTHLFTTTSRKNLTDGHLWFSVFTRPVRSRFTRVQRVSCCAALLYLSMLTNAMYYQRVDEDTSKGFNFGPFSLTPEQVGVGFMSNIIVFFPSFLIIYLFKNSRRRQLRESRIDKAITEQRRIQLDTEKNNPFSRYARPAGPPSNRQGDAPEAAATYVPPGAVLHKKTIVKKKRLLPWWCKWIAWILVFISIVGSVFLVWAYGVQFGNGKTTKWLTSLFISFFTSILLTQPIKVFLVAMFLSAICKNANEDEDDVYYDEYNPKLEHDEAWLYTPAGERRQRLDYQPMSNAALEKMRLQREKEVRMWDIITEILAYAFFIWILMVLCYGNVDPNAFLLKRHLHISLVQPSSKFSSFLTVKNVGRWYKWIENVFLSRFVIGPNYNNESVRPEERLLAGDRNNLIMGKVLLRQVRIRDESNCELSSHVVNVDVTSHCRKFSELIWEDNLDYNPGWVPKYNASWPAYNGSWTNYKDAFIHREADYLNGLPFWGDRDWYGGGGYVVFLDTTRGYNSLVSTLEDLYRMMWIDERTRAIFLEMSLYNAQVNLFVSGVFLAEQGPEGGIWTKVSLQPIRLLYYHTGFGLFVLICEILTFLFIVYYTYRELSEMCRDRSKYWKNYWNYLELMVLVLGYPAMVFYVYRKVLGDRISSDFERNQGGSYVNLQYVKYLDDMFTCFVALLLFFATLKFVKLLRFNKRMGVLAITLNQCGKDLGSFGIILLLMFLACGSFFLLHLGPYVQKFSSFTKAFASTVFSAVGSKSFREMSIANRVLGPIMFFFFSIFVSMILMNFVLAIIMKSFAAVKEDIMRRNNEYEMLDFILGKLKSIVGMKNNEVNIVNEEEEKDLKRKELEAKNEQLPEKVDQLLDYVNSFYFDGSLDIHNKDWQKKTLKEGKGAAGGSAAPGTARAIKVRSARSWDREDF